MKTTREHVEIFQALQFRCQRRDTKSLLSQFELVDDLRMVRTLLDVHEKDLLEKSGTVAPDLDSAICVTRVARHFAGYDRIDKSYCADVVHIIAAAKDTDDLMAIIEEEDEVEEEQE